MTRFIGIVAEKGGVGKTTTAVTLAHDLARRGHVVCLIDLDTQGHLARCLGLPQQPGLFNVMTGRVRLADALVEARPNLWLLPGDPSTKELKELLIQRRYRETILARALADIDAAFVVIDTGPGRDILHDNAHHAVNEVVIPVSCDYLALVGVQQTFDTLAEVRNDGGHPVEVTAILPTFYDKTTKESDTNRAKLRATFGDLVLDAIPRTTKLREAPAFGQTLWEYLPAGHAAALAYRKLTARVLHE